MNVNANGTARPTLWGSLKDAAKGFAPVKAAAGELFSQTAADLTETFHSSDKTLTEKLKIAAGQVADTAKEQVGLPEAKPGQGLQGAAQTFSLARTKIQDINAGTRADLLSTIQNKDLTFSQKLAQTSQRLLQNAASTASATVETVVHQPQPGPAPMTIEQFHSNQMKAIAAPPANLPEQVWNIR